MTEDDLDKLLGFYADCTLTDLDLVSEYCINLKRQCDAINEERIRNGMAEFEGSTIVGEILKWDEEQQTLAQE